MVHLKIRGEAGDQLVTSWCVQPKLKPWFLTSLQLAICDLQETYGWSEVLCSEQRWLEYFFFWLELRRLSKRSLAMSRGSSLSWDTAGFVKFASNSLQIRFNIFKRELVCFTKLTKFVSESLTHQVCQLRTQLSQLLQKQCGRAAGASMVFWQDSSIVPNGFPMGSQWVPNGCLTGCESRTDLGWWSTGGWRFFNGIPSRSNLSLPVERHVFDDFQQKR